jgi:glycosyltransferase involved in cell wall biosynthesis
MELGEINQSGKQLIHSVAVVHNLYVSDSPSGEDVVADEECRLLQAHGLAVYRYSRFNDELKGARFWKLALAALQAPWSLSTYRDMRRFLARCKPDVVHVHNTFPLISYSVVDACHDAGVPCVATIHNYRFICANGLLLRDGQPCEECLNAGSVLPGLRYRCYRKRLLATLPVAAIIAFNRARSLWLRRLPGIIALTEFQKARLVGNGAPADKVVVKPNFVKAATAPLEWGNRDLGFLFVGRLSHEKGIRVLIDVWKRLSGVTGKLTVIGDGPLRCELQRGCPQGVEFLGQLPHDEVLRQMRRTRVLVFPSTCFEGFPLTIVEAFSCGVPVIASRIGGIPEIVDEGVVGELVNPGDVEAWCDAIRKFSENPDGLESMGENALRKHRSLYSPERNAQILLSVYQQAVSMGVQK